MTQRRPPYHPLACLAAVCALSTLPLTATAWDDEATEWDDADTGAGDSRTLDDTWEDTERMEPPEDAEIVPEDEAVGTEPAPSPDPGEPDPAPATGDTGLEQPTDAGDLDDTWEDTHTIGDDQAESAPTGQEPVDPAEQIEERMEQQQEGVEPGEPLPETATEPAPEHATGWAWMHRYDHIGLYGVERGDDDSGLEGIYFHGYAGPTGGSQGSSGLVTILAADLPVATEGDSVGEGYIGFGLQGGSRRLSLYGTIGGVYTRTVRASEETESDTSLGAEAGINVGLGERSMITLAMREDPNELIDEQRVRLGVHFGAAYIGVRHGLDSELGRVDLAVRF